MTVPDGRLLRTVSLADSHVHLDRYAEDELAALLVRANAAGVGRLLTVGTDRESSLAGLSLAMQHAGVLAAVGIHPRRVAEIEGPEHVIWSLAMLGGAAAIGEVGLDADAPDLEEQAYFLDASLDLADEVHLPLVLHVVGPPEVHALALGRLRTRAPVSAVVHYFVGHGELARRYLEVGCDISVGKPVTRPENAALREAVAEIPLDRLLLETDTYPLLGRTTEPRDLPAICAEVAELRGVAPALVAERTAASFERLFGRRLPLIGLA
ncbi:MAG: TatD family hydrolase [Chloroflexota bacterium]|nr:TatD family hydrolase [Chloroflexota bacterium]